MLNLERWCVNIKNINIEISSNDGLNVSGGVFFYILSDEKREEQKMNYLINLANYLISLYDTLDDKYFAMQVKISKLLVIAELYANIHSQELPFLPIETEYSFSTCGIKIPALERSFDGIRIYISSGVEINRPCDLTEKEMMTLKNPNFEYVPEETKNVNPTHKAVLLKVFLRFASYDAGELGKMLNDIKPENLKNKNFIAHSEDITKLIDNINTNTFKNNEIVDFIKNN